MAKDIFDVIYADYIKSYWLTDGDLIFIASPRFVSKQYVAGDYATRNLFSPLFWRGFQYSKEMGVTRWS
jgi:hypothetical protein